MIIYNVGVGHGGASLADTMIAQTEEIELMGEDVSSYHLHKKLYVYSKMVDTTKEKTNALYINTKTGGGTAADRTISRSVIINESPNIINVIKSEINNIEIDQTSQPPLVVIVSVSLGGGSGSGIGPYLTKQLKESMQSFVGQEKFSSVVVFGVAIIPRLESHEGTLMGIQNTQNALVEMDEYVVEDGLSFVLADNNSVPQMSNPDQFRKFVNNTIAKDLLRFLIFGFVNNNDNQKLDISERLIAFDTPGYITLWSMPSEQLMTASLPFSSPQGGIMVYELKNKEELNELEPTLLRIQNLSGGGMPNPMQVFIGYGEEEGEEIIPSIIGFFGQSPPEKLHQNLKTKLQSLEQTINETSEVSLKGAYHRLRMGGFRRKEKSQPKGEETKSESI